MWVDPKARGRGVARDLIRAVARWAAARGSTRVVLFVQEANEPAQHLYARAGFRPTGDRAPAAGGRSALKLVLAAPVGELKRGGGEKICLSPDRPAADQDGLDGEVVVEHDQVGGRSRPQHRDVVAAEHACRGARHGSDRLDDRHAQLDQHPQAPRERADGARERAVRQSRDAALDRDVDRAEPERPVTEAAGRDRDRRRAQSGHAAARQAVRIVSGARCTPSAISCTITSARASAAPATPGSRCPKGRIALKRCVTVRAPWSNAACATRSGRVRVAERDGDVAPDERVDQLARARQLRARA